MGGVATKIKYMDILPLTAQIKYMQFVFLKLASESDEYTLGDIKKTFKEKYSTELQPLNNQYFGIMRLLPLFFIRESEKGRKDLSKDITIIRHAIAHNQVTCDESGYTFTCDKGVVKKSVEELSFFCCDVEREYFKVPSPNSSRILYIDD